MPHPETKPESCGVAILADDIREYSPEVLELATEHMDYSSAENKTSARQQEINQLLTSEDFSEADVADITPVAEYAQRGFRATTTIKELGCAGCELSSLCGTTAQLRRHEEVGLEQDEILQKVAERITDRRAARLQQEFENSAQEDESGFIAGVLKASEINEDLSATALATNELKTTREQAAALAKANFTQSPSLRFDAELDLIDSNSAAITYKGHTYSVVNLLPIGNNNQHAATRQKNGLTDFGENIDRNLDKIEHALDPQSTGRDDAYAPRSLKVGPDNLTCHRIKLDPVNRGLERTVVYVISDGQDQRTVFFATRSNSNQRAHDNLKNELKGAPN